MGAFGILEGIIEDGIEVDTEEIRLGLEMS